MALPTETEAHSQGELVRQRSDPPLPFPFILSIFNLFRMMTSQDRFCAQFVRRSLPSYQRPVPINKNYPAGVYEVSGFKVTDEFL
jgi:hypothetical protein